MKFFKSLIFVINIISFICVCIFTILGLYEQIVGPAGLEKLFKKLNFPLGYNGFLVAGIICLAIMIISYYIRKNYIRKKLSGKM